MYDLHTWEVFTQRLNNSCSTTMLHLNPICQSTIPGPFKYGQSNTDRQTLSHLIKYTSIHVPVMI